MCFMFGADNKNSKHVHARWRLRGKSSDVVYQESAAKIDGKEWNYRTGWFSPRFCFLIILFIRWFNNFVNFFNRVICYWTPSSNFLYGSHSARQTYDSKISKFQTRWTYLCWRKCKQNSIKMDYCIYLASHVMYANEVSFISM